MRARALALIVCVVAIAGCLGGGPDPSGPSTPDEAPTGSPNGSERVMPCPATCEPSVAWNPAGDLLVTHRTGEALVSIEQGTGAINPLDPPPMPGDGDRRTDALLTTDPQGRVWFSALVGEEGNPASSFQTVQVARSDDGGETWALNRLLSMGNAEDANETSSTDRQWLVFDSPERAYLFCNCPGTPATSLRVTEDAGQTWSPPQPVATASARTGPVGRPAVGPEGTLVAPFLATASTDTMGAPGTVMAALSTDGGETWQTAPVSADPTVGVQNLGFPNAVAGPDGRFHVAWHDAEGRAVVATTQSPSGTWGQPRAISPDGVEGTYPHVWVETAGEGRVVASWYGVEDGDVVAFAAWEKPGEADWTVERLGEAREFATDHPHLAPGPEGRRAVPWAASGGGVQVQVLAPSG